MPRGDSSFPDADTDPEFHTASPTAHLLDELALYGYRPGQDEPDPRPLPIVGQMQGQLDGIVEAFSAMLTDTRLEDDLADLLWSFVNLFHRKIERIERELDSNEQAQRLGQVEQDGSEVKSVELERLINQGISLIERRNAFEFVRDHAAELYEAATGSAWRPHTGSMANHRALTAAVIDSREFIAARRRADTEVLAPAGARIAFTGGTDCNDHTRIWDTLDKIRAKHPDMVLLHGGSPRGAERIAACWADLAKYHRWSSSPTGRATATPHPSSATTGCSKPCRSASSCSPAPGLPPISPTRPKSSGYRRGALISRLRSRPRPAALRRRHHPPQIGAAPVIDAAAAGGSRLRTSQGSRSAPFHAGQDTPSRAPPALANLFRIAHSLFRPVIPEIDIWRAALLMLKRFGVNAPKESATRADYLETEGDRDGAATWRRITDAVEQLANPTPTGPVH